ncbi:hypothetical protein [Dactylosporangium salmoneum]|uniref:DUF4871 domain-containing protein n=1 Tax=Dactylosporangium salmoneum TaxID=53361 RepID=A0ABP5U706_9ACTN
MRLLPIVLVPLLALAGCTEAASPAPVRSGCGSPVDSGELPEWARGGFTGSSAVPHVLGDRGEIVAVLFGQPLTADRADGMANKVLWAAKADAAPGDLVIDATLDGGGETARRTVAGGPGPSILDLPRAGCWRLRLDWPGHHDTLDLSYR